MPTATDILAVLASLAEQILRTLASIATDLSTLAVAWHLAIAAVLLALWAGWRPSLRIGLALITAPLVSVAIVAFYYGNSFDAVSFGLLALFVLAMAAKAPALPATSLAPWSTTLGTILIAFGAVYPQFVEGAWYRALYAAPVGLVPSPTLAVVAGFTLLAGGFTGLAVTGVLAAWTAFYALFGVARLGVILDTGLILGALGLCALALRDVRIHSRRGAHRFSR